MISVAITTYNGSKYIIQQLKSIMNQTVKVDEVIIIDDISKDDTVKLVQKFIFDNKLENWSIHVNESNLGFSDNFFKAVKKTKGEIIFIADQDDEWELDKVEVMVSCMNNNPKIMLLWSDLTVIDREGKIIETVYERPKDSNFSEIYYEDWLFKNNALGCSMCIRKDVRDFLEKNGGPQLKNSLGHDWYFGIISSILGKSCSINIPLLRRRVHEENISLGHLRKSTLLSASNEKRLRLLKESIQAHMFLLDSYEISNMISEPDKVNTISMISYYQKRIKYTSYSNALTWLFIISNIKNYYKHQKSIRAAIRLCIIDILYAYDINWKLSKI
jgi:glycosyltransferase involved in cell wall biosynthesis